MKMIYFHFHQNKTITLFHTEPDGYSKMEAESWRFNGCIEVPNTRPPNAAFVATGSFPSWKHRHTSCEQTIACSLINTQFMTNLVINSGDF